MFVLKFKCKKCGKNSKAIPIIKKVQVVGMDAEKISEEIYLTEIVCEECGERFIVQIDNDYTYSLLEKQKKLDFDIGTTKYKYGASTRKIKKFEDKLKTVSQKLSKERNVLTKLYNDAEYFIDGEKIGTIKYHYDIETKIVEEN